MSALFDPRLVNDAFGDPALYVRLRFARQALLVDLGEVQRLTPRQLLRVSHVFVSHTHVDHFYGFDRLLLACLGRQRRLDLFGPPGFIERVEHKLAAYTWNLIGGNETDFVIGTAEIHGETLGAAAEFHTRDSFRRRAAACPALPDRVVAVGEEFCVRAVTLDHRTPCLAFALEQTCRINVWRDRLARLGLPVGPWPNALKAAVRHGAPDDAPFTVSWSDGGRRQERRASLGELKTAVLRIVPGQKIAYVTDAGYSEANAARIVALAAGADELFIEAGFLDGDRAIAAERHHLTAAQAGALARRAGAKCVTPFHFSARYRDRADDLRRELEEAYDGAAMAATP